VAAKAELQPVQGALAMAHIRKFFDIHMSLSGAQDI
jgi:hypothetical protein